MAGGRGNGKQRGKGGGRKPKSSSSTTTEQSTKTRKGLSDYVYYIGSARQASDFNTITNYIIMNIRKTFTPWGDDIADALESRIPFDPEIYRPKLKESKSENPKEKEHEDRQYSALYEAQIKSFVAREAAYESNQGRAYALLYQQCNKALQHRLETRVDFLTEIKGNPIKLLDAIEEHSLSYMEKKYAPIILVEALKNLVNLKQKDDESLVDYTKRFKSARDILKSHVGGDLQFLKLAKLDPSWKDPSVRVPSIPPTTAPDPTPSGSPSANPPPDPDETEDDTPEEDTQDDTPDDVPSTPSLRLSSIASAVMSTVAPLKESPDGSPSTDPSPSPIPSATPSSRPPSDRNYYAYKAAYHKFLAYLYMENADRRKYGTLLTTLSQQYALGQEGLYPPTLTDAQHVLSNHTFDQAHYDSLKNKRDKAKKEKKAADNAFGAKVTEARELSFAQMEGLCYKCGKPGHKSNQCKSKISDANNKANWAINRSPDIRGIQHVLATQASAGDEDGSVVSHSTRSSVPPPVAHAPHPSSTRGVLSWQQHLQYNFQQQSSLDLTDWLLLDSCSSVDLFCNPNFLQSIRPSPLPLRLSTNAGVVVTKQEADLPNYGPVWYNPRAITNVFSLGNVMDRYRVTVDSIKEHAFLVYTPNKITKFIRLTANLFAYIPQGTSDSTFAQAAALLASSGPRCHSCSGTHGAPKCQAKSRSNRDSKRGST